MEFEEVTRFEDGRGTIPDHWRQGRTAYGGALAAAGVRALRSLIPQGRNLRYFNAQFVAAVGLDEVTVETSLLSSGGSVSNAQARFFCESELCLQMTAVFAAPRFSTKPVAAEKERSEPRGKVEVLPYLEGITPQFTQNVDYQWLEGGMPFSGQTEPLLAGLCRHKTAAGAPEEAAIGLLDAWPAPVLPLLDRPTPASTVSWSAHLYDPPEHDNEAWWFYRAKPVVFTEGYATTQAHLYAPDGRLIAWSEQLVAVYEKAK